MCKHIRQLSRTVGNKFWQHGVLLSILRIKSVCVFEPGLETVHSEADSDVVLAADEEVTPENARTLEPETAMIDGEEPCEPATSEHGQVMAP